MPLKENDAAAFTLFSFTSCAQQKKRLLPPCALQPDSEVDGSWCSENLQLGLLLTECALALLPCAHRRLPRQFETLAEVLCVWSALISLGFISQTIISLHGHSQGPWIRWLTLTLQVCKSYEYFNVFFFCLSSFKMFDVIVLLWFSFPP